MEINVKYTKISKGINVRMTVIDFGDYPRGIFSHGRDFADFGYPYLEGYQIKEGNCNFIDEIFETPEEALKEVKDAINRIKKELRNWRENFVPLEENYRL